ncbi:MAG: alkaline phosphatase family protein [Planctomycetes bacterium]|nr:alkaline phosphatase family protein [Planctomycetota bacterium]
MMKNTSLMGVAALALSATGLCACGADGAAVVEANAQANESRRPKLVVLLSIDQFRADYLTRFDDLYLPPKSDGKPGGFRYLTETGAWFTDAHHDHYPTYTGPGHSVLLTGAAPHVSGIVGNQWYDRALKRVRYCVEGTPSDGAAEGKTTPETLRVTTVGDELETATGGQAKTWSFGLKDRAAVLMAGHLADGVFWFDDVRGKWETSDWYKGDDKAPEWIREWNKARGPDQSFGAKWEFGGGPQALARLWVPPGDPRPEAFSMTLDQGKPVSKGGEGKEAQAFYKNWARTPFATDWVLRTALRCVDAEQLGRDNIPDLLTINLSTNDYVGHAYGPDSAQVLDISVRTDRALSEFFRGLDEKVGLADCVVVLSADHGVAPNPLKSRKVGLPSGVQPDDDGGIGVSPQRDAAEKALDLAFGADDWVLSHVEHQVYLNREAILRHPTVTAERVEDVAARACEQFEGVYACWTRSQILNGRLPDVPEAKLVSRGFHRRISGDVIIVADPFWSPARGRDGATHGSVFTYDTKVPVVFCGFGVKAGRVRERASTLDIAPTLSELLGIAQPSGSEGRVLGEGLK